MNEEEKKTNAICFHRYLIASILMFSKLNYKQNRLRLKRAANVRVKVV